MSSRPEQVKKARISLARYCASAERSPKQIKGKLQKFTLAPEEIEEVVDQLARENFINYDRFCQAFVHDKLKFNNWGRNRIRQELYQHQLPVDSIDTALQAIDQGLYIDTLSELVRKKWESLKEKENPLIGKKKTVEYVVRKGFEASLAIEEVEKCMSRTRH